MTDKENKNNDHKEELQIFKDKATKEYRKKSIL